MAMYPIEGNSPFQDFLMDVNGTETNATAALLIPPGFIGWVEAHITMRLFNNQTETGIWCGRRKLTLSRPANNDNAPLNINVSNADVPGYFFASDNAAGYVVKLVRSGSEGSQGDGTGVCLMAHGGQEGASASFQVRMYLSGSTPL